MDLNIQRITYNFSQELSKLTKHINEVKLIEDKAIQNIGNQIY